MSKISRAGLPAQKIEPRLSRKPSQTRSLTPLFPSLYLFPPHPLQEDREEGQSVPRHPPQSSKGTDDR